MHSGSNGAVSLQLEDDLLALVDSTWSTCCARVRLIAGQYITIGTAGRDGVGDRLDAGIGVSKN